jgi:hypothetical protein
VLVDIAKDASKQGEEHTDSDQSTRNYSSDIVAPELGPPLQ